MTPEKVLLVIKQMTDKQKFGKKPIGLDSVALALKVNVQDLAPVIQVLRLNGSIIVHPNTSVKTKGLRKPDSVTLI